MTDDTSKVFEPRLDILPPAQRRLWDELGATPRHFVLYGDTAIALRLAHRQSEDFDFFSHRPFAPAELLRQVKYLNSAEVIQEKENTLTCLVDRGGPVHLSFFGDLGLNRVADPEVVAGPRIAVASLLDLAATKVAVVVQRASLKDYLDIGALLRAGIELPAALGAAAAVYGKQFNRVLSVKALTFFDEGDVKELDLDCRQLLAKAAQAVSLENLASIQGRPGLS